MATHKPEVLFWCTYMYTEMGPHGGVENGKLQIYNDVRPATKLYLYGGF